jgi:hypothetical protein
LSTGKICVEDSSSIIDLANFSVDCNQTNEKIILCPGNSSGISCTLNTSTRYVVSGLDHSGIRDFNGSGFSGSVCISNWSCGNWSACSAELRTRSCVDLKNCTNSTVPILQESCVMPCASNWSCSTWTNCFKNGTRTRTCLDENFCGTDLGKLPEEEVCEYKSSSLVWIILGIIFVLVLVGIILFFVLANSSKSSSSSTIISNNSSPPPSKPIQNVTYNPPPKVISSPVSPAPLMPPQKVMWDSSSTSIPPTQSINPNPMPPQKVGPPETQNEKN